MEHKTNAVEVSFLKKTKWTGTTTRTLTFPVGELADRCLNAWLDITDESFSHATLPSTQLTERFSTLMKSDADQAAWLLFSDKKYHFISLYSFIAEIYHKKRRTSRYAFPYSSVQYKF